MNDTQTDIRTVGCHMEHGNRLGIAGITSSPMPGVILPEDTDTVLLFSQLQYVNIHLRMKDLGIFFLI